MAQPREPFLFFFLFCVSRPLTIPAAKVRALQIPVLRESPETKASISSATKSPLTTDGALHFPFWVVGSGGGGVALLGAVAHLAGFQITTYRVVPRLLISLSCSGYSFFLGWLFIYLLLFFDTVEGF